MFNSFSLQRISTLTMSSFEKESPKFGDAGGVALRPARIPKFRSSGLPNIIILFFGVIRSLATQSASG